MLLLMRMMMMMIMMNMLFGDHNDSSQFYSKAPHTKLIVDVLIIYENKTQRVSVLNYLFMI